MTPEEGGEFVKMLRATFSTIAVRMLQPYALHSTHLVQCMHDHLHTCSLKIAILSTYSYCDTAPVLPVCNVLPSAAFKLQQLVR